MRAHALGVGLWAVTAFAQTDPVAEVAAKHAERCGTKAVFTVDPALRKLQSDSFNVAALCAPPMAAPSHWCTEDAFRNRIANLSLEGSGFDGANWPADARL